MDTTVMVASILTHYDRATATQIDEGWAWYTKANHMAVDMAEASGYTRQQCAAVIAHLSPRTKWADNVHRAWSLLTIGECTGLTASIDRARRAMAAFDPATTFGPSAHKTRAFYGNIIGDRDAVTIDTWAVKVAGVDGADLGSAKIYDAIAEAYRIASDMRGVSPRVMQATTWCVIRGKAE